MAPAAVRRCRRAGGGDAYAAQRHRQRTHRAGIRLCRLARMRQDDDGAHPGAGAQLREGADRRSLRRVRRLRRDRPGARHRRARDRRGQPYRHRQHPRGRHRRARRFRRLADRYKMFIIDEVHQLSTAVVQRAAEVDRGAAAARRLHDGDDRAAQDSGHHPLALAGVRVPHDSTEGHQRAASHASPMPSRSRCPTPRSR